MKSQPFGILVASVVDFGPKSEKDLSAFLLSTGRCPVPDDRRTLSASLHALCLDFLSLSSAGAWAHKLTALAAVRRASPCPAGLCARARSQNWPSKKSLKCHQLAAPQPCSLLPPLPAAFHSSFCHYKDTDLSVNRGICEAWHLTQALPVSSLPGTLAPELD